MSPVFSRLLRVMMARRRPARLALAAVLLVPAGHAAPRLKDTDPVFAPYASRTERSVEKALEYLLRSTKEDGTFEGQFGKCPGVIGLAGMAFLAAGHTPRDGTPEAKAIVQCARYILAKQDRKGWMGTEGGRMYGHCISVLYLSELSGMVEPELQEEIDKAVAKGIQIIVAAQQIQKEEKYQGGWRYDAQSRDSDTSVSGWAIMALRSARLNGAPIPDRVIGDAVKYLMRHYHKEKGCFGYEGTDDHDVNMTGCALLCLELCGAHGKPETFRAGDFLLKEHARLENEHWREYGTYYIAQGMFQLGGKYWETYARWMYEYWIDRQNDDGSWIERGDVNPPYYTAMIVLSLTVPYRQLPIYQRDETVDE